MSKRALLPIALGIIAVQGLHADDAVPRATQLFRSLPIVFEPNAGRWNPDVKFAARTSDYRVQLSSRGVQFTSRGDRPHTVSISPLNANPKAIVSGDDPLPFRTNYFLGSRKENWRAGVANYSRVRYAGVYPGIDLVYYGSNQDLEYDFVVHPGADPSRIRLKFQGVKSMRVNDAGDLVVDGGAARLVQRRPVIYQEQPGGGRRAIRGKFQLLAKNVIGFQLGSYDRSQTLTIDPVLTYSTLLGGTSADRVTAAAVDSSGFVYLTGVVGSRDLNVTSAFPTDTLADFDGFLAKIDPNASGAASLLYFTYLGGGSADIPNAIALDNLGNVYLTGSTASLNFPLAGGGPQNSLNNSPASEGLVATDAFVTMIRPSEPGLGGLFYSTYLGGSREDIGYGIAVDNQAAIYVVGSTRSYEDTETTDVTEGFPFTDAAYQKVLYGPQDAFVAKLVPGASPSLVFSTYLGGEAFDEGRSIAVSPTSGAVYIAGNTNSAGLPQAGQAYSTVGGGNGDMFVAELDLAQFGEATLTYMTFFGGRGFDFLSKIALDSTDRVLLTGYTLSSDLPVTPDAFQTSLRGAANPFVTRLDLKAPGQSGLSYSTFFGGSNGDVAYDLAIDAAGMVYLTGYTVSTDFPVTADALERTLSGGIDVFVSKLNLGNSGSSALVYSTYVGELGVNVGYAVTVSPDGRNIYVGGQTGARHVPTTEGGYQTGYAGGASDGFLLVLGTPAQ